MESSQRVYVWLGKGPTGRWVHGHMMAHSGDALRFALLQQRIRLCAHCGLSETLWKRLSTRRVTPLRSHDLTHLCRQLATLMQAGLPLLQSLRLMGQDAATQASARAAWQLSQHIEAGTSLSEGLRRNGLLDHTSQQLIAAGEASGQLDSMLARLATHREKSEALAKRLRSALIYPCLIAVVGVVVSVLLLGWVVPAFEQMFSSLDAELPALTRWVLGMSRLITTQGEALLSLTLVVGWGLHAGARHTRLGQRSWDHLRLHAPLLKVLTRHSQCARWCRTLATLLQAGIALDDALLHTAEVMGHRRYQHVTWLMHRQLTEGRSLSHTLRRHPDLFDPWLIQMCVIGEESGTLDDMLARMAEHHESAVDTLTQRLATLMEPAIMLVLGLTMGTLVLAMYWPIFQIGQVL